MIRTILPLSLLPLLLALSPARAQEPTPAQAEEETFFESIDVEVVNLEVFVTDREGKPITGLTREEFEVVEDGKPVEVTNFFGVDAEVREAAPSPAAADPATNPATAPSTGPAPGEQTLHLAIVIDNLTLTPQNRNRLLQSIEKDVLPRLRPANRALVAVVDGSAVRIVQRLTSDPAELRAALEQTTLTAPQGVARMTEKRELLSRIDSVGLQVPGESANLNVNVVEQLYYDLQTYAQQRTLEARTSLGAVSAFVSSLSGLPGRKAMLYVGGGLSVRPGEALYQAWQNKFGSIGPARGLDMRSSSFEGRREDLTRAFEDLVEHANANRVTFYSLGALEELGGVSAASGGSGNWGIDLENLEKMNLQESLETLAGGTGGIAAVDLPDPRSMFDRMRQDFDSYYSLGYVPARRRDGKNRKIEVRVRGRKDLAVRHRQGRRDQTNRERMTDRTLAALMLDAGGNPLELAVDFVGEKSEKKEYQVDVLVKFPLAKLVLLPKERFHEGQVILFVGARDSHGRMSPVQEIAVPIRVPNDQLLTALGQTAAYKATLRLRPETHTVAVSIRDELGNTDSAIAVEYTPGKK